MSYHAPAKHDTAIEYPSICLFVITTEPASRDGRFHGIAWNCSLFSDAKDLGEYLGGHSQRRSQVQAESKNRRF